MPGVADLARLALRRAYERLEAGEAEVSIRDAVAVLRLAHEIEHDAAVAERDAARRQLEEWEHGLWIIRNAIVRQYGNTAVRQYGRTPGWRSRPRSVSSVLLRPGNRQPGWRGRLALVRLGLAIFRYIDPGLVITGAVSIVTLSLESSAADRHVHFPRLSGHLASSANGLLPGVPIDAETASGHVAC